MSDKVMMRCGHSANSTMRTENGDIPACVICGETVVRVVPDLTGRMARCAYFGREGVPGCGNEKPSSTDLWFFEYRGEGSKEERHCKTCGMMDFVHKSVSTDGINPATGRAARDDHPFMSKGPNEYDTWYCACRGTD